MTTPTLEILAYEQTSLGPLCLRRRTTLSDPPQVVTEITLNHEFLMSSLHTDSERALADLALAQTPGDGLQVLIGGLGLGYTVQAALASPRVAHVEVVEFLPEVIRWLAEGLVPLAEELRGHPRLQITAGDIYARLLTSPSEARFNAVLIDVDHSPEDQLAEEPNSFYTTTGLDRAADHLQPGGVLALWSYAEHTPLLDAMHEVPALTDVQAHPIIYFNQHVQEVFTDWLYVARRRE